MKAPIRNKTYENTNEGWTELTYITNLSWAETIYYNSSQLSYFPLFSQFHIKKSSLQYMQLDFSFS